MAFSLAKFEPLVTHSQADKYGASTTSPGVDSGSSFLLRTPGSASEHDSAYVSTVALATLRGSPEVAGDERSPSRTSSVVRASPEVAGDERSPSRTSSVVRASPEVAGDERSPSTAPLTVDRLLALFAGNDIAGIQQAVRELPAARECLEFAARHTDEITALRDGNGWVSCKSSWTAAEGARYDNLRQEAVRLVTTAVMQIGIELGYRDPGAIKVFGTAAYSSDIDVNYVPPPGMPETVQGVVKVLFDALFFSALGGNSTTVWDVSFYLPHPADADQPNPAPVDCSLVHMQLVAAAWHAPTILESDASQVIKDCKSSVEGEDGVALDWDKYALSKMHYIIKFSTEIDRLQALLAEVPAEDIAEKQRLHLQIARYQTYRIALFEESYVTNGAFVVVCGGHESQQEQIDLINPLVDSRESGEPSVELVRRTSKKGNPRVYREPHGLEQLSSCVENGAMLVAHYNALRRADVSPGDALLACSKYWARSLGAIGAVGPQDFAVLSVNDTESKELVAQRQELPVAADVERCKRGNFSPTMFRIYLEKKLTYLFGESQTDNIRFIGEYMQSLLVVLVVQDKHLGVSLTKKEQAELIRERFNEIFIFFESRRTADLNPTLRERFFTEVDQLISAVLGDGPEELKREMRADRVKLLEAQGDTEELMQSFHSWLQNLQKLCCHSIPAETRERELEAIRELFAIS